jgi:hypothetical protein
MVKDIKYKDKIVTLEDFRVSCGFKDLDIKEAYYEDGTKLTEEELFDVWVKCGDQIFDIYEELKFYKGE